MEFMDYIRQQPPSRASSAQSKVDYYMRAESRLSEIPKPEPEEEESRAQYAWRVVKHCVRDAIDLTMQADVTENTVSHGIQSTRKILHAQPVQQMLYNKNTKEFITLDGHMLRVFRSDGRKKEVVEPEESFNRLLHATQINLFIGWTYGQTRILLMNPEFEITSCCNALGPIYSMVYNENVGECVCTGAGFITSWVFRYGGRHLLPRKITQDGLDPDEILRNLVLEQTASRSQRGFACTGRGVVVFNLFEGNVLEYKQDLHVRQIKAILFFNPLKYLITASKDGTIKVWDQQWHLQLVFVGHCAAVTCLAVYPYGPNIMSASRDSSIRVWSLETCDEVDMIKTDDVAYQLGTMVNSDTFFSVCPRNAEIWKVQHIHRLHTRINQKVSLIKVTDHPEYPIRAVVLCRDASVRITSPETGDVLTTLLMPPGKGLVDAAYAVADNMMFAVFADGEIVKAYTESNPCTVLEHWPCDDVTQACNYLLVYEYVISADISTDTWGGFKRIAATRGLAPGGGGLAPAGGTGGLAPSRPMSRQQARTPMGSNTNTANRTLLLGGRKDGHICVFNMDTGKVEFQIEAHGSKGVLSMKANSKADQLISAGLDNIIKVWRLYPYAQESLAPLMSFYCAHLPIYMTVLRNHLAVAFQEHSSATYSIVMYNLQGKNRMDHGAEDDHQDSITGLSACNKMKLIASSSNDGTIRIWNDQNQLIRVIRLNTTASSVSFCSHKGDLLLGVGDHVHRIDYKTYMPKSYRFKMVAMKFETFEKDEPLPFDDDLLSQLNKDEERRLKNARSSFKFTHFMDVLTGEENEEVMRERKMRQEGYQKLEAREQELEKIKDGEVSAKKKRKATKKTRSEAFNKYLEFFYTRNTFELPVEEMTINDKVTEAFREEPLEKKDTSWYPEKAPVGFFPGPAVAKYAPHPPPPKETPIKRDGLIPNSVLARILFPVPDEVVLEEAEYRPPVLDDAQLAELDEARRRGEERTLVMEWSDDEEIKDEDLVSEMSGPPAGISDIMARIDNAMTTDEPEPEPEEEEEERQVKDTTSGFVSIPDLTAEPRKTLPRRPIQKLVAPPPDPMSSIPQNTRRFPQRRAKTPTPPPTPEPTETLPKYISDYKDEPWFTQYFPNLNENTMPKPWTVGAFVQMLVKILRITDYENKCHVLDALREIHATEVIPCVDLVCKTIYSIFSHHTTPPTTLDPHQREFIGKALDLLHELRLYDKDFYAELMVQYMETDKDIRKQVQGILDSIGLIDPNDYLAKELDSWDTWNLDDSDRAGELRRMCGAWLDRWMTSFKLHLQDTIEKLKSGSAVAGHTTPSSLHKAGVASSSSKASKKDTDRILSGRPCSLQPIPSSGLATFNNRIGEGPITVMMDRAPEELTVDGATYMDALNYFCEMEHDKQLERLRAGRGSDQKNTVLVLPKIQAPKGTLVRLGETHTSKCRPNRETQYAVDLRLPPVTTRGKVPPPGELYGFPNCINLPLKSVDMNPFITEKERREIEQHTPILLMLKTAQKYFVHDRSIVPPDNC